MAVETLAQPQLQQEQVGGCHHKFTVDDYYRMAEQGMLPPDARVELIEGEVLTMSPIGGRHIECVMLISEILGPVVREHARVSTQNPVRLTNASEPEPDIAIVKRRSYNDGVPLAEDVYLAIEVADTTLQFDLNRKVPLYAASGIPEVWIVDLNAAMVTRYTGPNEGAYDRQERFRRGQTLSIEALPSVTVAIDDILPKD